MATLQIIAVRIQVAHKGEPGNRVLTCRFPPREPVIGASGAAAVLTFALAVVAPFADHAVPGDGVSPGLVGLICGIALLFAGVVLVVHVMWTLLGPVVARGLEVEHPLQKHDHI